MTPNQITVENEKTGTPRAIWDAAISDQIEGFATDISVDNGDTVDFKINVNAEPGDDVPYRVEIYRLGYYGGDGATLVTAFNTVGQAQPDPITDERGLVDAGNWNVSASWTTPADAVSGVYLAKLQRLDANGDPIAGATNQIPFIVREDELRADGTKSDILLQTSDTTWQAYNGWGGNNGQVAGNFYGGFDQPDNLTDDPGFFSQDRAFAVSYNRPIITRDGGGAAAGAQDYLFGADYAAIFWLEKNGYDVSYISGVDTDRLGSTYMTGHKAFISVGHDEYWSGAQRDNVEAARDAGVNLLFWSGNEIYWKTRYETSISEDGTAYRTLVCYKETWANGSIDAGPDDYANIDPSNEWTGTWRDLRFVGNPGATGQEPENALTGQLFGPDGTGEFGGALDIPASFAGLRVWRDTGVPTTGQLDIAAGILGYEWDTSPEDAFRPAGLIKLSATTIPWSGILIDEGNREAPGIATHNLSLYRDAESGALVFGAGTVFWTWALSNQHDSSPYGATIENTALQQFTVNMFADMGIQPGVADAVLLSHGLLRATGSTDTVAATTTLADIPDQVSALSTVTISGTAADTGGQVAVVEVSLDDGVTWRVAAGTTSWTYNWRPTVEGTYAIQARSIDDSLNMTGIVMSEDSVEVTAAVIPDTVSLFDPAGPPPNIETADVTDYELGVKFMASVEGQITALQYYRGAIDANDIDIRTLNLWGAAGNLLTSVVVTSGVGETGWQIGVLGTAVTIDANTLYVASYGTTQNYAASNNFFVAEHSGPFGILTAPASGTVGGNGVYNDTQGPGFFPTASFLASNYWVDVVFALAGPENLDRPPSITSNGGSDTATVSVIENSIAVTAVQATDPDQQAAIYSIVLPDGLNGAGADGALFSIDPTTGALTFAAAPDFGQPADAGANNVYDVTVRAADPDGNTDDQTIAVTVLDTPPPSAGFEGAAVRVAYVFGTSLETFLLDPADVVGGAGIELLHFPEDPNDPGTIGNFGLGLVDVDLDGERIAFEFPVHNSYTDGLTFSGEATHPFNGISINDLLGNLPAILGVSIASQSGFTRTGRLGDPAGIEQSDISWTADSIFVNWANEYREPNNSDQNPQATLVLDVDFNDAPVIVSNGGGEQATVDVAAGTTLVAGVIAFDPDNEPVPRQVLGTSIVGGEDAALFELRDDNQLHFRTAPLAAALPDAGATAGYQVQVAVTDGFGGVDVQSFAVTVTDPNEAPIGLALSASTIAENNAANAAVATLTGQDPDTDDSLSYALIAGTGDTDNAAFTIVGDQLILTGVADFETQASYDVRLQVADAAGATFETNVTIGVNNLQEGRSGGIAISGYAPSGTTVTLTAASSIVDPDGIAGTIAYSWQRIAGGLELGTGPSFTASGTAATGPLRLVGTYTDGFGEIATLTAPQTAVIGRAERIDSLAGGDSPTFILGRGGRDVLTGGASADTLDGGADNDQLSGDGGDDFLFGGTGKEQLFGGDGNDVLVGGLGIDSLTGGAGADLFRFDLPSEGRDKIFDFVSGEDRIGIDAAGFDELDEIVLTLGRSASGTDAQFIYNVRTGALFWDADGTGGIAAQVGVALLLTKPALALADMQLIG